MIDHLDYYCYCHEIASCPLSTRIADRRSKRRADSALSSPLQAHAEVKQHEEYDTAQSDFTLFFFAESTCRNSLRVGPMVAEFVRRDISNNDGKGSTHPCQVICIPNDEDSRGVDTLCTGMGFFHMPIRHPNRRACITLLSVSRVPTVVVVNNSTGRVVTDRGLEAIEQNPLGAVEAWNKGYSGASLLGICIIS